MKQKHLEEVFDLNTMFVALTQRYEASYRCIAHCISERVRAGKPVASSLLLSFEDMKKLVSDRAVIKYRAKRMLDENFRRRAKSACGSKKPTDDPIVRKARARAKSEAAKKATPTPWQGPSIEDFSKKGGNRKAA